MIKYYSDEKNVQILVALLKKHNIRRVIASPGSANSPFVLSLQKDSFFKMYSSADERSAAYMACGLSSESNEPVVISCTGATASRNYLPGLTEAYYRKLPVLAVTSTRAISNIGHLVDQVMDRSIIPKDVAKISLTLPIIRDNNDIWECEIKVNQALLELKRRGSGPVHINLTTNYTDTYTTRELPKVNMVKRITPFDNYPELPNCKIGVLIGSHKYFSEKLTKQIDIFCSNNNAVVFCDHTSNYKGIYRVLFPLLLSQTQFDKKKIMPNLIIHIGEISAFIGPFKQYIQKVWRISEDGEVRDTLHRLSFIFEMPENVFFKHYEFNCLKKENTYFKQISTLIIEINNEVPELPFSNIWIASKLAKKIPDNSIMHFGILNSLRAWNFFELPNTVYSQSNVGGFGIDGCMSTLIGASLVNSNKLYFGIIGDLAFFYDINSLGNRNVGKNLRILLINNGKGSEFKFFTHKTASFGNDADEYIAAAHHYGDKSTNLVKHFVTDLDFDYLTASNKKEFENVYEKFIKKNDKSIVFEAFTNDFDENEALKDMMKIKIDLKIKSKNIIKNIIGEKKLKKLKKLLK